MSSVVSLPIQADVDKDAIAQVFARQQETAIRWRRSTAEERIARIKRLRDGVIARTEDIRAAGAADFGKPEVEVDLTEIVPVIADANHTIRKLKSWMKPKSVMPTSMMFGTKGYMQYEPMGTSLIISPWNYPINLSFMPLVSALAAGCPAIIKPSEMTPNQSALMAEMVKNLFPEEEVALFEGEVEVSQALLDLPFEHIFFTGSPAVGKVVMSAASKNLAKVTLELGGKSPTIVDETADLDLAAKNIMWGKYTNNGQTCIAPDHIYVHESVREEFVAKARDTIGNFFGSSAKEQLENKNYCRIVNERHTQRIQALLDDARERGAEVLVGGESSEQDCFIQPTLLGKIPADAKIMSEEIFGPLLPIIGYQNIDEVIKLVNSDEKPLALYIWSKNDRNIDKVMKETSSGGACINHTVVHYLHTNLPFGGVNNSGLGSSHGIFGFKAFSHERAVVKTRFMLARMFFPPHGEFVRRIISMLKKFL